MKEPVILRTGGNGRRSTCVQSGGTLYVSGITTTDLGADTTDQTKDIFAQLDKLMAFNNTHKHNILYASVFLRDMADYGSFNAVWDEWVDDGYEPARSVVQAHSALEEYRVKIALTVAVPT